MKTKKQIMHEYFIALGKKGGSAKSPKKTVAARLNVQARWENHVKLGVKK